ncbi:HNH endonuclease signature motif containing protein [Halobaculum sp. MBLA0147]|uniref:HNH endonuclease signature motif containing protein n=1 Tax=Halobaculum sp. MBLA0147 TaxID=3079934 RepID=UPI00352383BC
MTNRNLTTTRKQVFGDVEPGTECRICGRDVDDGRRKTCSDFCDNLLTAVMGMLNWSSIRRRMIDRDDATCQGCGWDRRREQTARDHIRTLIDEAAGPRPESPDLDGDHENFDWNTHSKKMQAWRDRRENAITRYGDPDEQSRTLHVDHITPIADGGHPYDPGNLQTLCSECHSEKTARENENRDQTPSRGELSRKLTEFVSE